jgi:hypothetical protein
MSKALLTGSGLGLLCGVLLLAACGGGGGGGGGTNGLTYDGNADPAAIDATNAEAIGTTSADAVSRVVDTEALSESPFGVAISTGSTGLASQQVKDIVKRIIDDITKNIDLPVGVTYTAEQLNNFISEQAGTTIDWFCGGSMEGPSNLNADSGTFTFNDLCFDLFGDNMDVVVMNGTVNYKYSENGSNWKETTTYSNVTITMNGETYSYSGTQTCSGNYDTFEETCADLYTGSDGKVYQIADADFYGDNTNGYYVTVTFSHPTYGSVDISTTDPITFNCSNGWPDSGTISFTGASGSSGTITFNDCTGYTITYDDGAGGASSFNGTW